MMYPYMILCDEIKISHSSIIEKDGTETIIIKFDRDSDEASCELPTYTWLSNNGFSENEIDMFTQLVESNAHLFYKYAKVGGVNLDKDNADPIDQAIYEAEKEMEAGEKTIDLDTAFERLNKKYYGEMTKDDRDQAISELMDILAEAEDDVANGRVAPIEDNYASIKKCYSERLNSNYKVWRIKFEYD